MRNLNSEDKFQCCLPYLDDPEKILLGTIKGFIYLGKLKPIDEIKSLSFNKENFIIVLEEYHEILKLKGIVRSMQFIDNDNIIILTNEGEIVDYNRNTGTYYFIQNYIGSQHNRPWRLLILNHSNFITIGNYRKIEHWFKENSKFRNKTLLEGGYPLFCIDWIDLKKTKIIINGNDGYTSFWNYLDSNLNKISDFYIDKNLQKCLSTEKGLIFSIDYFGTLYIYKEKDQVLEKIEEYLISFAQGNWVHYSYEINMILVGNDDNLLILTENLDNISNLKIESKQIFNIDKTDLILTSKTVVRPNYSKRIEVKDYQKYKYIKIGLVGDSRVGKTCFCKYLETERYIDTKSSFGKHVWTIELDDNRRILYYDLAGQASELYTYFPLIKDSEIILLFYNGLLKESFDKVIDYYKELKIDCKDTIFYFIQTYSNEDPDRLIKDWYIQKEFENMGLEYKKNLIKIDSFTGKGFNDYEIKVINEIDWNRATPIYRSNTYDKVEKFINDLYNSKTKSIKLDDLYTNVGLNKNILEHIILSFKNQGKIEYIEEEKEIIINDELYEKMHSLISEKIDGNDGYVKSNQLLTCLGSDNIRIKYVSSILEYYRENQICLFFKEEDKDNEIVILTRKLKNNLKIPETLKNKIPLTETILYYKSITIDLSLLIHFLSQFSLKLISISKTEILLENQRNSTLIKLSYNKNVILQYEDVFCFIISLDKKDESDFEFEKEILNYLLEKIGNNLIDYSYKSNSTQKTNFDSFEEEIKFLLKTPFESPYLDFKTLINLKSDLNKAEIIKDITALSNSSYLNNNCSYLFVGFVEEKFKIKNIHHISNIEAIEQFITQNCKNYLDVCPNIEFIPQKIHQLYYWQQNGEISSSIPLTDEQKGPENDENFLVVRISRPPNSVCEVANEFRYMKKGKEHFHRVGDSWFRVSSHTFRLRDSYRVILRNN